MGGFLRTRRRSAKRNVGSPSPLRHQENSVRSYKPSVFCGYGGIGRHARFRFWSEQGAGSSPVIRTENIAHFCFFSFFLSLGLIRPFSVIFYPIINKKTVSELLKIYNRNIDDKNPFVYNELNASVGLLCPLVTL